MELEADKGQATVDETIEKLRKQVMTMLSDGNSADDLAFALAFVATEMSMQLLNTPTAAVPVVLHGIAAAAFAKSRQEATGSNGNECSEEEPVHGLEATELNGNECSEELEPNQSVGVTLH